MNSNFNKLSKYKVLYLEDDFGIQTNIKEILEHYFKDVYVSNNTKDAYNLYQNNSPDLIISDIKMQNESGIDFIKKIRQKSQFYKYIYLNIFNFKSSCHLSIF